MFPLNTILAWNINIIMNKKYDNNNIIIASRAYFLQWSPHSVALAHAQRGPLRCASSPVLSCSAQAEAPLRRASSFLVIGSLVKPFSCFLLAQQRRPGGALPAPHLLLHSSVVVWRSHPSVLLVLLKAALLWHFLCEKKRVDRRGSEELIDKG
jgi:hypothetical protein